VFGSTRITNTFIFDIVSLSVERVLQVGTIYSYPLPCGIHLLLIHPEVFRAKE